MSRRKKSNSPIIDAGVKRAAGMESIDPQLDLGNGLTLAAFKTELADAETKRATYNTLLSQADEAANAFEAAEKRIRDLNERMLAGVASRFGKDSDAYEMAGGTRKSERKRIKRKAAAPGSSGR